MREMSAAACFLEYCAGSLKTAPSSSNSDVNHACVLTALQMKYSVRRRLSLSERDHQKRSYEHLVEKILIGAQ